MPRYEYYVEPGDAIDIVNFDPNDKVRVFGTGADKAAKRLRKENERKGVELHSRQCSIDALKRRVEYFESLARVNLDDAENLQAELRRREGAITHRDKEIVKLESHIRALQGRRPHPPRYTVTCLGAGGINTYPPRFTCGGQQEVKGDWNRSYYINEGGQRVAEFKNRALRDQVVDDLNEEN